MERASSSAASRTVIAASLSSPLSFSSTRTSAEIAVSRSRCGACGSGSSSVTRYRMFRCRPRVAAG